MSNPIDDLRNDHSDFSRNTESLSFDNPWVGFEYWLSEAVRLQELEPNAMVISTVNASSMPSSRVVYLKEITDQTLVFYTNYRSAKGQDLWKNPQASLLFFWPGLERQIRIQGQVRKIDERVSDAYFASRPRESQLGAWASHQSEPLSSEEEIQLRFEQIAAQYPGKVPRPEHWGGLALSPSKFEFWQGKPSRLHERLVFEQQQDQWVVYRLNP